MNNPLDRTGGICVVGVGAATSIGMTGPSTAAAVRAGIANFTDHPDIVDQIGEPCVVARAPYLDSDVPGDDRIVHLAGRAACEALEPLGEKLAGRRVQVPAVIGLPESRPGLSAQLPATLAAKLTEATAVICPIAPPAILPNGHSAGLMAMESADRIVRSGQAEFCLAGGVDSYLDRDSLKWVANCEQLHYLENAWGFIPGEAAGFCLLCSQATADHHELNVLGNLLGVAVAHEENRIKTETVCIGKGITTAVHEVFKLLPSVKTRIDHWICDLNGEAYRADEIGFMLARTSERFVDPSDFAAPADCWGDVGAASGPLFVLLACAAARRGYAKGPVTLLLTSSEGGARGAALFLTKRDAA